jgi:hypothetical protein
MHTGQGRVESTCPPTLGHFMVISTGAASKQASPMRQILHTATKCSSFAFATTGVAAAQSASHMIGNFRRETTLCLKAGSALHWTVWIQLLRPRQASEANSHRYCEEVWETPCRRCHALVWVCTSLFEPRTRDLDHGALPNPSNPQSISPVSICGEYSILTQQVLTKPVGAGETRNPSRVGPGWKIASQDGPGVAEFHPTVC